MPHCRFWQCGTVSFSESVFCSYRLTRRETEEYFDRFGLSAQLDSDFFKYKRAAFYGAIESNAPRGA